MMLSVGIVLLLLGMGFIAAGAQFAVTVPTVGVPLIVVGLAFVLGGAFDVRRAFR